MVVKRILQRGQHYKAIAIQNPNVADAVVTVEAHAADCTLTGSTALAVPAGGRISRDASELFGDEPAGERSTRVVLALAKTILNAGPTGPAVDPGVKNGCGGGGGNGG